MKRFLLAIGVLWLAIVSAPAHAHDTVYYYLTDTLHSSVIITDANRNIVEGPTYYAPYGQVLNRSMRDGPGYTGHEEDPATGLVYMQQRYYDPQSGRFLSTDPVLPTADGGNFNRYWYANDNPYRYTDPDGLCPTKDEPCPPPPPKPKPKPITLPTITVTAHAIPAAPALPSDIPIELPEIPAIGVFVNPVTVFIVGISIPINLAPSDCGDGRCVMMSSAQDRPPPNSKPIDQTPWSGDHGKIKGDLGLGGKGKVVIDPNDNVWVQHPDGSWSNEGKAGNFTGSGKPSGRRGRDRDGH